MPSGKISYRASIQPFDNRSGRVFRVQFRVDGKGQQETFPTHDAAESFQKLVQKVGGKEARAVLKRRQNNDDGIPTLNAWCAKYLDPASGLLTGIEDGTRAGYESMARSSFLQFLGEYPVDAIGKTEVGKWVEWQERQPSRRSPRQTVAAKTVRNYHALLSNLFKAAVEAGYRTDNPAYKTRISRGLAREAVFLTPDEFRRLLAAVPDYYKPLVMFLTASQARWSEATALTWGDLNLDSLPPTVRITKAWKKNPGGKPVVSVTKSQRGRRTVSLWDEVITMLGQPKGPGELIFQGKLNGERIWYGGFNARIWKPSVQRAGLIRKPNIHDLRHTGASWLIADGQPLPYIQARLGHENITTTIQVYGHLVPDSHARMANSLAGIMAAPSVPRTAEEVEAELVALTERLELDSVTARKYRPPYIAN